MKKHITLNKTIIFVILCFNLEQSIAQMNQAKKSNSLTGKRLYVTWGYNRDWYSRSTIRFRDPVDNYDFKLYHAKAHDQPNQNHLLERELTVPQYDFNIGYIFNAKKQLGFEMSWDHLKYVMSEVQTVHVKGQIHGNKIDQDSLVTDKFLHYEHTNGNNYLRAALVKLNAVKIGHKNISHLNIISKVEAGVLWPKTQSVIMGAYNDGPFRPSGIVVGVSEGLRYDFFKYLYLETNFDLSWAWYTSAKLYGSGRARQNFFSLQYILSAGFSVPVE